ncbi:hypothetical protein NBRC111894_1679 [Sporolactobacillus inulinus]|uniref:Na+/H+ antiporter n=1 Tax=Sporolactobacillus inulinus TaxID=2078 RepID=A0A4Y1ZAQ5_9BACL|nr:hypothetical protein NBRC111894_1679 [Sporolactobacillus inulinus]
MDAKLLAEEFFTPLIVVVMVTTLVTPPLLKVLFENEHTQVNTTEK